jgi:hypothetical protein
MIEDICGYEMYEVFFTIPEQASANINRQLRKLNKIQKKEKYLSFINMKKTHSFFLNIIKKK